MNDQCLVNDGGIYETLSPYFPFKSILDVPRVPGDHFQDLLVFLFF